MNSAITTTRSATPPLLVRARFSPEILRIVPFRSPWAILALAPYQPTMRLAVTANVSTTPVEWDMRSIMIPRHNCALNLSIFDSTESAGSDRIRPILLAGLLPLPAPPLGESGHLCQDPA